MDKAHQTYMQHALSLAKKGMGNVSPNPMVGCVIVHNNTIVAEGYHQKFGEAHAEVNAVNAMPADIAPSDCTVYVTLEPCSHFGKTPPCADLLVKKGFKTVVICNTDPNPLVSGNGINKLKAAGVTVVTDVLEKEGRSLNKRFFTYHEKKRPYIILKWAQTADGFISRWPLPSNKEENWITHMEAKVMSHQLRASEDAILVGKNTVVNDDPELTTRLVHGKNPSRIILAGDLEDPLSYKAFNGMAKTLWYNYNENSADYNIVKIKIEPNGNELQQVLADLHKNGISSLIVEGGSYTLNKFIALGFWDEKWVFVNPELRFEQGIKAPETNLNTDYQSVGKDKLYVIYSKSII